MCDITKTLNLASKTIALVDDFVDEQTFAVLSKKPEDVKVTICSKNRIMTQMRNVKRRKAFASKVEFFETNNFRGRYLLIDERILFILSRSLRYNTKRNFYFIRIHDVEQISKIKNLVDEAAQKGRSLCRHF
jgi:hypothetical protein